MHHKQIATDLRSDNDRLRAANKRRQAEINRLREAMPTLAIAILELASKAATTWDYDGETMTGTGVFLDLERELEAIAALAKEEGK